MQQVGLEKTYNLLKEVNLQDVMSGYTVGLLGVLLVFGGFTGSKSIGDVHQVLWIPIIEYLFVFIYFTDMVTKFGKWSD